MFKSTIKRLFGPGKIKDEKVTAEVTAQSMQRTRGRFLSGFRGVFSGSKNQQEIKEALEAFLYTSDLSGGVVGQMLEALKPLKQPWRLDDVGETWRKFVSERLTVEDGAATNSNLPAPFVIILVGVNGTGKTTTAAKLAHFFKNQGKSVLLAAADTYRAAAVEQLQTWADRLNVPCVKGQEGGDAAAVAFDAIRSAQSKTTDVVIIDTAGRLHTDDNLVNSLRKLRDTVTKALGREADEILLTLDATLGQNSIQQARSFNDALGLTGLVLTKLDSSAKGGAIVAIVDAIQVPVTFVGSGEQPENIAVFDSEAYADALFGDLEEALESYS